LFAKPGKPSQHHRGDLRSAARFSADGRTLTAASGTLLHRLTVPSLAALPTVRLEMNPTGPFVLGPDAEVAVGVTDDPKQVAVCDAASGRRKATLASPAKVLHLSVTRDGKTVVAACDDGCLRLWHLD
jgi:WD40 repeat protein